MEIHETLNFEMPFKISDDFSKNVFLILDMSKNAGTPWDSIFKQILEFIISFYKLNLFI